MTVLDDRPTGRRSPHLRGFLAVLLDLPSASLPALLAVSWMTYAAWYWWWI